MKKTAGFTLVELIVVIAILAILAGIAIPVYSGYISKAQEAADYQTLDAVKTAAVFATVDHYNSAVVNKVVVNTSGITTTFTGAGDTTSYTMTADEITTYLGSTPTFKSGATGATWENDKWELNKASSGGEG